MIASSRPTRRTVLRVGCGLAVAALAGCTSGGSGPDGADGGPASPVPVDPDDALRAAAAERERALLREYDWLLLALPGLGARLTPLRAHHAEHLAALLGPEAALTASPGAASTVVPPPASAAVALATLRAAERAAGDLHARDCLAASRSLAGVLGSLSASELSHLVALA